MLFTIKNNKYLSTEQLRTSTLLDAYLAIKYYPMHAADKVLDQFITQQYKASLKDICIKLLLNMTFYTDEEGNLILLFKNQKYDQLASLITYGNGAIPGSRILQTAFNK